EETYNVPEITDPVDVSILQKLYVYPPLTSRRADIPWSCVLARDLHTTDDRDLFRSFDTGTPLLKGDDIDQYKIRTPFSLWVDPEGYATRGKGAEASRVVWRAIAGVNDPRRLYATLV